MSQLLLWPHGSCEASSPTAAWPVPTPPQSLRAEKGLCRGWAELPRPKTGAKCESTVL